MLQKLFTFLILTLFLIIGESKAQMPAPPVLGLGEYWTNNWSISYDYQTNGSVRYLVQDPSNPNNWCAILMAQHDSLDAAGTNRFIYYGYSDDGGVTWNNDVLTTAASHGFPCMTLSNGIPVIADHQGSTIGTLVYKDVIFGGFSFSVISGTPIPGPPIPIWPHVTSASNGNITFIGAPNPGPFSGAWSTYNGTSWSPLTTITAISGPSGNFDASASASGKVALLGTDYDNSVLNNGGAALTAYESNDNGLTFGAGFTTVPAITVGSETITPALTGGYQSVYIGGELHVVAAVYQATLTVFPNANTTEYVEPRIYHWSQSTGLNLVASKANIPNLADTITQINMAPLTQPTLSLTSSGKLVCAYTTFLYGNTQVVNNGDAVNAGEIFVSVSDDAGATWSQPKNITNTPNVEEKHPSLSPVTASDSLRIHYLRDMKAGGWVVVPDWGLAPVYGIFYKASLTGIKENLSIAKTYELFQNYPNPFNPTTTISYYNQKTGPVTLKVYDMIGREVTTLVNEVQSSGSKVVSFNGNNLSSGIYYYTLTAGDFKDTKKMMLVK